MTTDIDWRHVATREEIQHCISWKGPDRAILPCLHSVLGRHINVVDVKISMDFPFFFYRCDRYNEKGFYVGMEPNCRFQGQPKPLKLHARGGRLVA